MIPKGGTENAAKETNHILGDIARIKKNIQENPEKESFSRQLLEAVDKLKIAREKEIAQNSEDVGNFNNPLLEAKELMALSTGECFCICLFILINIVQCQ